MVADYRTVAFEHYGRECSECGTTEMETCQEQGMSARETAEYVPYSHATISNWWKDIDEGGEKRDWVNIVEQVIALHRRVGKV